MHSAVLIGCLESGLLDWNTGMTWTACSWFLRTQCSHPSLAVLLR